MYTINYDTKSTSATTQYIHLAKDDHEILVQSIMSLNNWIQEISISQDQDIKSFVKWYVTSNKKYPFNSKLKRYNSPQTIVAGVLNNLLWGTQQDFSLIQLELIQELNNIMIDIVEVIREEKNINVQSKPKYTKIWCQENIWLAGNHP